MARFYGATVGRYIYKKHHTFDGHCALWSITYDITTTNVYVTAHRDHCGYLACATTLDWSEPTFAFTTHMLDSY